MLFSHRCVHAQNCHKYSLPTGLRNNDCMQIVASDKLAPGAYVQGTSYPRQPREGLSKGLSTL